VLTSGQKDANRWLLGEKHEIALYGGCAQGAGRSRLAFVVSSNERTQRIRG
jgi:hypothetical protein